MRPYKRLTAAAFTVHASVNVGCVAMAGHELARREQLVFFQLRTTVPDDVAEFAAVVLEKRGLIEIETYSTLLSAKPSKDAGYTEEMLRNAPSFEEVAPKIQDLLRGRIWLAQIGNFRLSLCLTFVVVQVRLWLRKHEPPAQTGFHPHWCASSRAMWHN